MLSLRRFFWWAGSVIRSVGLPQPTAGLTVGVVCVVIFSSHYGISHFGVALASVRTACTFPGLWHHFGWTMAKDMLEGRGLQENAGVECLVSTRLVQVW